VLVCSWKELETSVQIFDVLIDEHSRIERLAHRLEAAPPEAIAMRRELLDNLRETWTHHARAEEKTFYDPLRTIDGSFDEVVLEAYANHNAIEALMRELEILNPADSRFDAKARALYYAMVRHFEEEESWIFDAAKRRLAASDPEHWAENYLSDYLSSAVSNKSSSSL